MSVLLVTGPSAAGKNTVSQALAERRERCAVIDVDVVRWMYRKPHRAPWEGEEGRAQQRLGIENACLLAERFSECGLDVVILDVVTDDTAGLYKKLIPSIKIALLLPSFAEALRRLAGRPPTVSEGEFNMTYQWSESLTIYDEKID
ncbi:MAG TPA: hypothetical protein VER55_04345, partial [Ardenticatenaceae bacterium]|nr:hypothetical protein [Ardenticatenaceae bacterium]